jgi:hypothetical protein
MRRVATDRPDAVALFCLAAGLMDASTGLALIAAPTFTLSLMGIGSMPAEPIFLRWIGAFVLAVGLSYFLALRLEAGRLVTTDDQPLATTLTISALVRSVIAVFVATSVAAGALEAMWSSVAVTDAAVAAIQIAILRKRTAHKGAGNG